MLDACDSGRSHVDQVITLFCIYAFAIGCTGGVYVAILPMNINMKLLFLLPQETKVLTCNMYFSSF